MKKITTFGAVAALAAAGVASSPLGATAAATPQTPTTTAAPARASLMASEQQQAPAVAKSLGLSGDEKLKVKDAFKDADGTSHVRYDRTFKGLRVIGGDLIVHETPTGTVKGVDKAGSGKAAVASTTPGITAAAAQGKGASLAKAAGEKSTSELVVYAAGAKPVLAYDVVTTGVKADQTPTRLHTFVDATTGAVLGSWDTIQTTGKNANVGTGNSIYSGQVQVGTTGSGSSWSMTDPAHGNSNTTDLNGSESGNGTTFTDADNVWGTGSPSNRQSAAVDAHWGAGVTWDFYKNTVGRNGIWDDGRGARSRVHYGNAYVNAFWDGTQMTYGDGAGNTKPLVQLDVAAHEMTHGVTENTAGLIYSGDAGGLNESNSDVFGTATEFYANNSKDVGDYLIGELININGNNTPLRYMDKPSKDGQSKDCWTTSTGGLNPHYSSGVGNHAFYLMSEGTGSKTINGVSYSSTSCNGTTFAGIGRADAVKIWYHALKTYMKSTETYPQARGDMIKSAIALYGANSTQCAGITQAWAAVNVPHPTGTGWPTCGTTTSTSPTSTSTSPTSTSTSPTSTTTTNPSGNVLVNPGFESGANVGWTGSAGPVSNSTDRPARTGTWKLWLGGNGKATTETINQTVTVPAGGKLSFYIRTDTAETGSTAYDTMRVQVVSGSTASTLGTFTNVGTSSTYTLKTYDVSRFAGQSVTIRFTSTEDSYLQTSWVIDDTSLSS